MTIYPKDPASAVDFSVDWAEWLTAGEAITSAVWSIAPQGAGAPTLGQTTDGGAVQGVFVSGGTLGHRYRLTCHIETDAGREADRSLNLRIMEQ